MKSISRRGLDRRKENQFLRHEDPFTFTEDILSDLYFYWMRRQDSMPKNDYRNRILVKGMLSSMRAAYELVDIVRTNLTSEGRKLTRRKNGN